MSPKTVLRVMRYPQIAPIFCCRLLDRRGDQKHLCRVLWCDVACGLYSVSGGLRAGPCGSGQQKNNPSSALSLTVGGKNVSI